MRSAVPEAFHHEVFRTIDDALSAPPSVGPPPTADPQAGPPGDSQAGPSGDPHAGPPK
jgi:hypothetical protein